MFLRDGDQPREQQNHAVARVLPQIQQHNHPKGALRVQPVCQRQAQGIQPPIDDPRLGKQQFYQQHRPHHRHDIGQQQNGLQSLVLLGVAFQQQGNGVGQNQDQRQGYRQEFQRISESQPKYAAAQHASVGLQTYEFSGTPGAQLEGVFQNHQKGHREKEQTAAHQRQDQQQPFPGIAPGADGISLHALTPPPGATTGPDRPAGPVRRYPRQ